MNLNKETTLFIAIDMQDFILNMGKNTAPYTASAILEKNEELIKAMHEQGIATALVNVTKKILPKPVREKMLKLSFKEELLNHELSAIYTKYQPSAYAIPELKAYLEEHKIETVVITGLVTNNGVLNTVKDLVPAGYNVIAVEDAMSARTKELHDEGIAELKTMATVASSAELLA
jgi:nicotinamidase-related amidase